MNDQKSFFARIAADTNIYKINQVSHESFKYGAPIIIKSEFGEDLAYVTSFPFDSKADTPHCSNASFIRYAQEDDFEKVKKREEKSKNLKAQIRQMSHKRNLEMNITHILVPLDEASIGVFYTATDRVDFRELLKDLRSEFKGKKIIMRQVGNKARQDSFALDARIPFQKRRFYS